MLRHIVCKGTGGLKYVRGWQWPKCRRREREPRRGRTNGKEDGIEVMRKGMSVPLLCCCCYFESGHTGRKVGVAKWWNRGNVEIV